MRQNWRKLGMFLALSLAASAVAQEPSYLRPFTDASGPPSGPTVNSISAYAGFYSLGSPTNTAGELAGPSSLGHLWVGGLSTDVGWYLSGKQTQAFVDYSIAYNGNAEYSSLGGFDHFLTLGLQTKLAPRVTLVVDARGESATFGGFLYEPTSSLSLTETGGAPDLLGGAPTSTVVGGGVTNSPLSVLLYGATRRDASGGAKVVFAQSSRTTWTVGSEFVRYLPSATTGPGVAGSFAYPGLTQGTAVMGFMYSLSRRTSFDAELGYSRSYWAGSGAQTGSALLGLSHNLSRRWFARVFGGYGGLAMFPASLKVPYVGAAQGGGSIGTKIDNTSVSFAASRSISDSYGLAASNTTTGQLAFTWQRPGSGWTVSGTGGYERLEGSTFALIQGWIGQFSVTRRVGRQFAIAAQGVYATDEGPATGDFASLMRRGVRLSLTWRPRGEQGK